MLLTSLLFWSMLGGSVHDHAIYLSVLEIDIQEMRIKVFQDNLEDAIRYNSPNFKPGGAFDVENRPAIEAYFQRKVDLSITDRTVHFYLQNVTVEGDSYLLVFQLAPYETGKTFELEASYLMELFPDQTNVVKVLGTPPQYFRLTKFFPTCRFSR